MIISSNEVGSYELKRTPCEMQMEERSAHLARSTSDGSADNDNDKILNNNEDNNKHSNYRDNNLWAAAAAADPSWDRMSGERESRGRLCEYIARF